LNAPVIALSVAYIVFTGNIRIVMRIQIMLKKLVIREHNMRARRMVMT